MLKPLLILFLLVSACVAIHGIGMGLGIAWFRKSAPRPDSGYSLLRTHWCLVGVVYGLLVLHLIQIVVWAAFYRAVGCFPDLATSVYYSASSYSTVGYGDVVPGPEWRVFGAAEAVTGVIMFGWSTGVLVAVVHRLYYRCFNPPAPVPPPEVRKSPATP